LEKKAIPALIQALIDKDEDVRYAVAYALGKIGRNAGPAKAAKAVPALTEALKDENQFVRENAAKALKQIQKK
jgi:HEAT repeat protein